MIWRRLLTRLGCYRWAEQIEWECLSCGRSGAVEHIYRRPPTGWSTRAMTRQVRRDHDRPVRACFLPILQVRLLWRDRPQTGRRRALLVYHSFESATFWRRR